MAAEKDQEMLTDLAERLGLEDDEKENFVNSGMRRLGYKPREVWEDSDDDNPKSSDGDFFTTKRKPKREQRATKGKDPYSWMSD